MSQARVRLSVAQCQYSSETCIAAKTDGAATFGGHVEIDPGDTVRWIHAEDQHPAAFKIRFESLSGQACTAGPDLVNCWPCEETPPNSGFLNVNRGSHVDCTPKSNLTSVTYKVSGSNAVKDLDPVIVIRSNAGGDILARENLPALGGILVLGLLIGYLTARWLSRRSG